MSKAGGKIRLFADAHVFDKKYQGLSNYVKELYFQLGRKDNLEIYMGANDVNGLEKIFEAHPQIRLIKYKGKSAFSRLLYTIPEIISKYEIDYAHFQYSIPPSKKCTYIVTIHDLNFSEFPGEFSFPYRLSKKFLYRDAVRRADIITTVSANTKRSIQKQLDVANANIQVIPGGVSDRFFESFDKAIAQQYILEKFGVGRFVLYAAQYELRKNHVGLLKSWTDLKLWKQGIHLVMLGPQGSNTAQFEESLANLGEEARKYIFTRKDIMEDDLLNFYRAASLFVYPSLATGFGSPPLEAGALGIPVICSRNTAMGDFGFFGTGHIDVSDPELLNKTISFYLGNPPARIALQEIRETIQKNYSWEQAAEKFHQLLLHHHESGYAKPKIPNDQAVIS